MGAGWNTRAPQLFCVDLEGTPHGLWLFRFGTFTYLCLAYTVDFRRGQKQLQSPSSRLTQSMNPLWWIAGHIKYYFTCPRFTLLRPGLQAVRVHANYGRLFRHGTRRVELHTYSD